MKKGDVINLIRCHVEGDDPGFRFQASEIAKDFERDGSVALAEYIMGLLSGSNAFVPQSLGGASHFLMPLHTSSDDSFRSLVLPELLLDDLEGVVNACRNNFDVHRFLFYGEPGTGKTESVKAIAHMLDKELYLVALSQLVDSLLGQTPKNIELLFGEINRIAHPERVLIFFDEIDALTLTRLDSNDVREMGRATSAMLRGLDGLNKSVLLFATTNLFPAVDKALVRRFDVTLSFDRYTREDLVRVASTVVARYLERSPNLKSVKSLFKKILELFPALPLPGDLSNMIRAAVVMSRQGEPYDYLRRLYRSATGHRPNDVYRLHEQGFTYREIEMLSGVSKSTVARMIKEPTSKVSA